MTAVFRQSAVVDHRFSMDKVVTLDGNVSTAKSALAINRTWQFSPGIGARQIDQSYSVQRTIGATTTVTINLSNGPTNVFGRGIDINYIKYMIFENRATNVDDVLHIKPYDTEGTWIDGNNNDAYIIIRGGYSATSPGGTFILATGTDPTGYDITGGARIQIYNPNDAAINCIIHIIGMSAIP